MISEFTLTTERLFIRPLTIEDARFILGLVNTDGWIRFIGDRKIHTELEAVGYIQKILGSQNVSYWVVSLRDHPHPQQPGPGQKMGVVTFIRRDYLRYPDIGFAFLPAFSRKGYAFEATRNVLRKLIHDRGLTHIHAITMPENTRSVSLLARLGLIFERQMQVEEETIYLYGCQDPGISCC